jgi:hypothetical protein
MRWVDIIRYPKTKNDLVGKCARQMPFVNFKKIFSRNTHPHLVLNEKKYPEYSCVLWTAPGRG